jgi:hypothetical protein
MILSNMSPWEYSLNEGLLKKKLLNFFIYSFDVLILKIKF